MQQHSGQHVLSAAFIELYQMPTVSFHMAEDYCSIDLATPALTVRSKLSGPRSAPIRLCLRIVQCEFAMFRGRTRRSWACENCLRRERDELRIIEVEDFDLSACGGTHVSASGQIGSILLRKTEKVRQGTRVEFVCGQRAVRMARRDFSALSEAAGLFSAQLWDVPEQIRKSAVESKLLRRQKDDALDELAGLMALSALHEQSEKNGRKIVARVFADRDVNFAKLFAQKATRTATPAIALVASTIDPSGLIFAQTVMASVGTSGSSDMGALLKQVLSSVGGRGGGSRDFAQGGIPAGSNVNVEQLLREAAGRIEG